jgi:hypothetical protein
MEYLLLDKILTKFTHKANFLVTKSIFCRPSEREFLEDGKINFIFMVQTELGKSALQ